MTIYTQDVLCNEKLIFQGNTVNRNFVETRLISRVLLSYKVQVFFTEKFHRMGHREKRYNQMTVGSKIEYDERTVNRNIQMTLWGLRLNMMKEQ